MPRKPIELPPEVAKAFMKGTCARSSLRGATPSIAARQIYVLRQYQGCHARPIRLHEMKEMLHLMRDEIG
jgi:hypothetical protein